MAFWGPRLLDFIKFAYGEKSLNLDRTDKKLKATHDFRFVCGLILANVLEI